MHLRRVNKGYGYKVLIPVKKDEIIVIMHWFIKCTLTLYLCL